VVHPVQRHQRQREGPCVCRLARWRDVDAHARSGQL
jgi:hypothetical protein